jgi:hypothetical protein
MVCAAVVLAWGKVLSVEPLALMSADFWRGVEKVPPMSARPSPSGVIACTLRPVAPRVAGDDHAGSMAVGEGRTVRATVLLGRSPLSLVTTTE